MIEGSGDWYPLADYSSVNFVFQEIDGVRIINGQEHSLVQPVPASIMELHPGASATDGDNKTAARLFEFYRSFEVGPSSLCFF